MEDDGRLFIGGVFAQHDYDAAVRRLAVQGPPQDLYFTQDEFETGGSKYPLRRHLRAHTPDEGQLGALIYYPPRRRNGVVKVHNLHVVPDKRRRGIGSALMDEMQRRHPDSTIEHGDRTFEGEDWWAGYTQDKSVRRGRTAALDWADPGHKPDYQPLHEGASDEQVMAHGDRQRAIRNDWERGVRHGLAMGHLSTADALERGYHGSGHDRHPQVSGPNWAPLPHTLYHVSTDVPSVHRHGLKSRDELGQDSGKGLGGGENDTISYTDDPKIARDIHHSLGEFHDVVTGKVSPHQLMERARTGDMGSRPFEREMRDSNLMNIDRVLRGRQKHPDMTPRTQSEMDAEHGPGKYLPDPERPGWEAPRGRVHLNWERESTPDEHREDAAQLYKHFAHWRQYAGGHPDPLFFGTDVKGLAATRREDHGIVKVHAKPGAQGYQLRSLGEWRSPTGHNVEVDRSHDPHIAALGPSLAAQDCPTCHGAGSEHFANDKGDEWDRACYTCGGTGRTHEQGDWPKPDYPPEQEKVNSAEDSTRRRHRALDLARHPVPGTVVWRGEVRHNDERGKAPSSVGMHWTVKPEMVVMGGHDLSEDHHRVMWQGVVDHPQEQTIPRSHPIWSGRHQSMDSEAEVRLKPGAKVRLTGAYTSTVPHSAPSPDHPEYSPANWSFHPFTDHQATVEHRRSRNDGLMAYHEAFPDLFTHHAQSDAVPFETARLGLAWPGRARHGSARLGEAGKEARFTPHERVFGRTWGMDRRLWEPSGALKPDVRVYLLRKVGKFLSGHYGPGWEHWARIYFAGSEASMWTGPDRIGNSDFDTLIGVNYPAMRKAVPALAHASNARITDMLNDQLKAELRDPAEMIPVEGTLTGPWDATFYVNKDSWDIRDIRPYAAYDVVANEWAVKPPDLPDWSLDKMPKAVVKALKAAESYARDILRLPEPQRTQQGAALFDSWHSDRSRAFSPHGEGWYDFGNLREKWLDQVGLWKDLVECKHRDEEGLGMGPEDWSNTPPYYEVPDTPVTTPKKYKTHAEFRAAQRKGLAKEGTALAPERTEEEEDEPHEYPPIYREHLSTPDGRRSRPVTHEQFQEHARRGHEKFEQLRREGGGSSGLDDNWDKLVRHAYKETRTPWGGTTIHTGTGTRVHPDSWGYALTTRAPGTPEISVPHDASHEEFGKAMRRAREVHGDMLQHRGAHLGVFRDEDKKTIDFDPVTLVHKREDVDDIGAFTRATGGAYYYRDGDGYWPPHVSEEARAARHHPVTSSYGDYLHGGGLDRVREQLYSQPQHQPGEQWATDQFPGTVGWVRTEKMLPLRHHDATANPRSPGVTEALAEGFRHGEGWLSPLQLNYSAEDHAAWLGEGNHRLEAARRAGQSHVPVTIAHVRGGELPGHYRPAPFPQKVHSYPELKALRGQSGDTIHPAHILPADWFSVSGHEHTGRFQHRPAGPPRPEDNYQGGQPAHDLDFGRSGSSRYDASPTRRVRTLFDHPDTKVIRALMNARGEPEHPLTMYRALPHKHIESGFRPGDWVTLSKAYAQSHARGNGYAVIKATAPAKHLWTEGDYNEWGYHGEPVQGEVHTLGRQAQRVNATASSTRLERAWGAGHESALFGDGPLTSGPWQQAGRRKDLRDFDSALVQAVVNAPEHHHMQDVDPRILRATQGSLIRPGLRHYLGDRYERTGETYADMHLAGNRRPIVYRREDGQHLILSGHHRAAAALLQGRPLQAVVVSGPWGPPR